MCDCGCNTCETKSTLMLNESLAPRDILSEGLKYHMDANKPLTEHLYRAGSDNYFNLWAEARSLYSREILEITHEDDLAVLTETDLGHFGMFEGKKVPLDFPMLNETNKISADNLSRIITSLGDDYSGENIGIGKYKITTPNGDEIVLTRSKDKKNWFYEPSNVALKVLTEAEYKGKEVKLNKPTRDSSGGKAYKVYVKDPKTKKIKTVRFGSGGLRAKINDKKAKKKNTLSNILNEIGDASLKPYEWTVKKSSSPSWDLGMEKPFIEAEYKFTTDKGVKYKAGFSEEEEHGFFHFAFYPEGGGIKDVVNKGEVFRVMSTIVDIFKDFIEKEEWSEIYYSSVRQNYGDKRREKLYMAYLKKNLPDWIKIEDIGLGDMALKNQKQDLNEAKKNTKKLNKPMRDSSGGKAYKVYVKDPKTKKIKTVRFGSGGLRAKINDKKARNAFAARHKCSTKKDKTKAGYWSCRLPRYASLLGLKSNFSGFW